MSKVCVSWVDPVSRLQRRERFDLPLLIGRAAGNDLILNDPEVARRHVLVREEHDQIVVTDLGSPTGTWVEGQRVEQAPIRDDTVVRLGTTTLTASIEAPADVRASTIDLNDWRDRSIEYDGTGAPLPCAMWSKGRITHVATSPRGDHFAIASTLGIQLHDTHTFAEQHSIQLGRPADRVVLADDGSVFAFAASEGVECWHIQHDHTRHVLIEREHVTGNFAVSPDGMTLAIDLGEEVQLMRVDEDTPRYTLAIDTSAPEACLAFSPDGQILAAASQEGIQLWSVSTGRRLSRLGQCSDDVQQMAFSSDGMLLAVTVAGSIMLWNVRRGILLRTLDGLKRRCVRTVFDHDGRSIAAAIAGAVYIWRVSDGMLLRTLKNVGNVIDIVFGPQGESLIAASTATVSIWHTHNGTLIHTIDGYQGSVEALAFAPNGRTLATAGAALKIWQIHDGKVVHTIQEHGDYMKGVAFSPDGHLLATTLDDRIRLWQLDEGIPAPALQERITESNGAAFTSDGKTLVSVGTGAVERWNIGTGSIAQWQVDDLATADNAEIASAGGVLASTAGNIVRVRRLADQRLLGEFDTRSAITCLALSPDGQYLAIGSDAMIQVWLISDAEQLYSLGAGASRLVFSQDGSTLAALHGTMLQLWQISNGTPLSTLAGHTDTVNACAFAPGGHLAASGSSDGTVRLWQF